MKILLLLVFVSLAVGSYSHGTPTKNNHGHPHLRQRRSFWDDISNEVSDDISRGSSCVTAAETFIEENPEVVAAAVRRRSIPDDHRLSKRGIKSWLNKLNPATYFYDCGMFIKDKGVQMYDAINKAIANQHRARRGITEDIGVASEKLSLIYEDSLEQMTKSVGKIASYLNSTEIPDEDLGVKVLHNSVKNVESFFKSFSSGYNQKTASNVFSNALNIFPQVGSSLRLLNWDALTSFQPISDISEAIKFSEDLKKSNLAHNIMMIMNYVQKINPEFKVQLQSVTEKIMLVAEEQHLNDLAGGVACINFLIKTNEMSNEISIFDSFDIVRILGYLNEAKKCGTFVVEHTDDLQTLPEKTKKLTDTFSGAVFESVKFLNSVEEHLGNVEKAIGEEDNKMIRNAVGKVKEFLVEALGEKSIEVMLNNFHDIIEGLNKVEEMTKVWSFLSKRNKKQVGIVRHVLPSKMGLYDNDRIGFLDHFNVISNAKVAQCFINLYKFAKLNPVHNILA